MNKRADHIIAIVSILAIVGTVVFTAYRYVFMRAYDVQLEAECNPLIQNCFVYECDDDAVETCDFVNGTYYGYYSMVVRGAQYMPSCDSEDCVMTDCTGDTSCSVVYCDPDTRSEEELCYSEIVYE